MRGRLSAAAIALAAFAMQLAPAPAAADHIFKFSGDCTDCSGKATATLVLKNFVLEGIGDGFVSFTYDGSNLIDSFTFTYSLGNEGNIGPYPQGYDVFLYGGPQARTFQTDRFGFWSTGFGTGAPLDYGTGGVWTLADPSGVPDVAPWAMMVAGFGAIGAMVRRKRVSFG